jgi:uncharacterized membrane protein YuzA (DUF378 family)
MNNKLNVLDWIAYVLVIIGGLNWALVGFFNFDLVVYLLGSFTILTRIVYVLVGLSALYFAGTIFNLQKKN